MKWGKVNPSEESLLAEQNRLLEMVAKGTPLPETLSTLVLMVEAQFKGMLCSVLLLDEDGQHVRHGAAPSLPEVYTRAIDGLAIGPRTGSCGTAMYRKEPVIVTDILQDPLWEDYRAAASPHGLRACWSTPILSHQGAVLGSFAMYYREPRSPSERETQLIEVSTHLAGIAIERQRSEEALRASEARYRAVVEGTSDAVFIKDLQGRYLMINSAGAHFLGKSVEEVIGKDDSEFVSADTLHAIQEGDRAVIATGGPRMFEITATIAGVTRTFLATKDVFRNAQGDVIGVFGISRDMTDLKRMESELRQAGKMEAVGRLAGGVAHDFNNLLTVINGCSELVYKRLGTDDPDRELIAEVRKAGERAANLTGQLLAFSRKQVLQPKVVNLNALLEEMHKLLKRLISADIEIVLTPHGDLGLAKVDPGQFEHACVNLALNARDAMPRGGRLTIETYNLELGPGSVEAPPDVPPGRYVVLAISDTGQGIEEGVLAKVFEPFFTTKGLGTGTGLGLAMVYGFVKQSGGHIAASSEPGRGTTFRVYLPRVEETTASPLTIPESAGATSGTETVLVVEDEDSVRAFVKAVLESSGYTVLEAGDGEDGLSVAEHYKGTIDLLLTDMIMPRMSGRQLAGHLVQARPQIRVLFMSGYTDEAVLRHGVQEASIAFLQKPFDLMSLLRKVREVLEAARV